MRYCTNEHCPHRVRTGAPAEYGDQQTVCGDCGDELSADVPLLTKSAGAAGSVGWPGALRRRLWITVGLGLAVLLLPLTPSPFLNFDTATAMGAGSWIWASRQMGPFALGILPILSGFVLVELVCLAVPRWNRQRHGVVSFRHRMTIAAFVLSLLLALVQGYFMALWVQTLALSPPVYAGMYDQEPLVESVGFAFRLHFALTQAAGTAVLALIALGISRYGVGNGFAVLLLLGLVTEVPRIALGNAKWVRLGAVSPGHLLFFGIGLAVLGVAVAWVLLRPPRWARGDLPLPMPACGLWPLELATPLTLLPVQLAVLINTPWFRRLAEVMTPGSVHTLRIELGVVLLTAPLAAWMFYWRYRPALAKPDNAMAWFRARIYSVGFVVGIAGVWYFLHNLFGNHIQSTLTVIMLVVGVAIGIDLWVEIRARRHAPGGADLVPLASYHHPVDALLDLDEQPAHAGAVIQGLRYRCLTYFFGPFVPLRVLGVPESDDER